MAKAPESLAPNSSCSVRERLVTIRRGGTVSKPDECDRTNIFLRKVLATAEIFQAVNEAWSRDQGTGGSPPGTKLKFIHAQFCDQYNTHAVFFIERSANGKARNLAVYYENDRPAFRAGIPDDWPENKVIRFVSSNTPGGLYPVWEIAARTSCSPMLGSLPNSEPDPSGNERA
jgi:hypothetical protein